MELNFAFLHGGAQGSWVWDETLAALELQSGGHLGRALALDIPGCGRKRGRATEELSVSEIVSELIAEIECADLANLCLVGHSQAGTILPLLVKARPSLFRRLIYVSCLAPTGAQTVLSWISEMPESAAALQHADLNGSRALYRAMFCNDMRPSQKEAFLDKLGPDQWPASSYQWSEWHYEHLGGLPATYVLCEQDAALVPSWQEIFAERLKTKSIIRVDAGHQVMNTRPHTLAEILRIEASR